MTETTEGAKEQKEQKKQKDQSRARCNHAMRKSNSNFTTSRWSLWLDSVRSVSCFNLRPSSRPTAVKSPHDHQSKKLTSPKPSCIRPRIPFIQHAPPLDLGNFRILGKFLHVWCVIAMLFRIRLEHFLLRFPLLSRCPCYPTVIMMKDHI